MGIRRIVSDGRAKKALFYLLAALLGGCVPVMSLHPLYTEKDVVFEERLLGRWVDDPNSPETIWEFDRAEEPNNAYNLVFSDEEGKKGSFVAHLFRLHNRLFLDVYPSEPPWEIEDPNKLELFYNSFFLIPVHTFIKIDFNGTKLKMWATNDEDMEKLLKEEPNAVKHTFIEDKLILTASTKELQNFVLKYVDDKRVFKSKIVLGRKKN
ncbi:MAG: hypothetical protein FVQ84_05850 [Planctomycetes bacterium]|nr:hypothetical protein [Planctomycetota bacterium]